MLARRLIAFVCVITLVANCAIAFTIDVHKEVTEQALQDLAILWTPPDSIRASLNNPWFTQKAIAEIVESNRSRDTCRPGENDLGKTCTTLRSEAISALINVTGAAGLPTWLIRAPGTFPLGQFPQQHFDAELIREGNALLVASRDQILTALAKKDFSMARKLFGGAIHAIQDFYAHSNWVELHRVELESGTALLENRLAEGTIDGPSSFSPKSSPRLADAHEYVCLDGNALMNDLTLEESSKLVAILQKIPKQEADIIQKTLDDFPLTTGYFGFPTDMPEVSQYLKCRHSLGFGNGLGGLDFLPGIDKDRPDSLLRLGAGRSAKYHDYAKHLAQVHTLKFALMFLDDPKLQKEHLDSIGGFMGQPTISSLEPVALQAGQDTVYVHVMGTGFTIDNAKTQPTVLLDGKPLETAPISSTRLDARLQKADLARARTAKISVRQQEADVEGALTGKTLNSNIVTLPINQPQVDCPGAIRPHIHDPRYFDVNANRWNDTGLIVAEGQRLNVQVLRGTTVWRAGGLLTGAAGEALPQGDPRATPLNTLLWIDPQIPISRTPIGALIGMILDLKSTDSALQPTIPLTEKPEGVKYFPILSGGQFVPPMPATGKLYLGINDGAFFNNGGCFQVRVVPVK